MKQIKGICVECGAFAESRGIEPQERWIVNKSRMLCNYHNNQRKKSGSKKYQYKRKATGELDMFKEIWDERAHVSFVSGKKLVEFDVKYFAHVLGKGAYPAFRLRKDNIVLLTPDEHYLYDMASNKIKGDPAWSELFKMKEKLKIEYNTRDRVQKF